MPKFVRLTPMDENNFKTVYINCDAIEKIFDTEDGAHITFLSGCEKHDAGEFDKGSIEPAMRFTTHFRREDSGRNHCRSWEMGRTEPGRVHVMG